MAAYLTLNRYMWDHTYHSHDTTCNSSGLFIPHVHVHLTCYLHLQLRVFHRTPPKTRKVSVTSKSVLDSDVLYSSIPKGDCCYQHRWDLGHNCWNSARYVRIKTIHACKTFHPLLDEFFLLDMDYYQFDCIYPVCWSVHSADIFTCTCTRVHGN